MKKKEEKKKEEEKGKDLFHFIFILFILGNNSRVAKRFFINVGFRSFNVLKVSRAKVLSLLTFIVHLLLFSVKFCSRFHNRLKKS